MKVLTQIFVIGFDRLFWKYYESDTFWDQNSIKKGYVPRVIFADKA